MEERTYHLHDGRSGAAITVRVKTGAKRTAIREIREDGTLLVDLEAAGVEAANRALVEYLAKILAVQKEQVEIIAGQSGSDKLVTITGLDRDMVDARILAQHR